MSLTLEASDTVAYKPSPPRPHEEAKRHKWKRIWNKMTAGAAVILKISILAAFVVPFLWMISTSLQTFEETMAFPLTLIPENPQWSNYVDAWNSGPFDLYLRNSVIVTTSIIVLQLALMIPAAYAFAVYEFKFQRTLFAMVLLAFMIPGQVTFIPVYLMMADWNLIDTLIPQIVPAMANAFGVFLLRQYFRQVPKEIIEAARMDGASEFRIMARIMVPMAKPALATAVLFSFVSHWNDYFWPLVMTNSIDVRPLTIGIAMLRQTEGVSSWNIIMAGNVLLVIPILLVYFFASKNIINAFTYSGIK